MSEKNYSFHKRFERTFAFFVHFSFELHTNNWYFIKNVMGRNTSILLGDHFEEFVSNEVSSGKYNSVSEVIRTALRLLELEEQKKKDLNKALVQGEKSGYEKNFNPKNNLKKLHTKIFEK